MMRAGVLPSPNIWRWPRLYEIENRAQDVHDEVWRVVREFCDWSGRDVVDVGCGGGFHLPRFAATARSVIGVEPHAGLVAMARERTAGESTVDVRVGTAQRLPLPDAAADLVHARTAYFFGRGCEPGLREADRVLRPGGRMVIVDLDATVPPYGDWMRAYLPAYRPAEVDEFFGGEGFDCRRVVTTWRFPDRESLAAALGIEFSAAVARRALADVRGLSFPVGYRVLCRAKPTGLLV